MLFTALTWLYALFLSLSYGIFLFRTYSRFLPHAKQPRLYLLALSGFCLVSVLTSYLSLRIPIAGTAHLLLSGGAVLILCANGRWIMRELRALPRIRWSWQLLVGILFASLVIIFCAIKSSEPTLNYDSGLYHLQAIQWINKYKVIPGLGNLHGRFAFNSAWFLPAALLDFSFASQNPVHGINGLVFLIAFLPLAAKLPQLLRGTVRLTTVILLVLFPVAIFVYGPEMSSPSTDMPAAILAWVAAILFLEKYEQGAPEFDFQSLTVALVCIFAVTVKLSLAPLFLIGLLIAWGARRSPRILLILAGVSAFTLVPFFIRNYLLSGYLIYPLSSLDLFHPDWKIPLLLVENEQKWILSWARYPQADFSQVLGKPVRFWAPHWYASLGVFNRTLCILVVGSVIGSFVSAAGYVAVTGSRGLRILRSQWPVMLTFGITLLGTAYWFLSAPDFRFGYGFTMLDVSIPIGSAIYLLLTRRPRFAWLGTLTVLVALGYVGRASFREVRSTTVPRVHPAPYSVPPYRTLTYGPLTLRATVDDDDQCWNISLPCTPYPSADILMRGTSLTDGFRRR